MQPKKRHISRVISSLLAAMMLLVAVAGQSWTLTSLPVEKDKSEQSGKETADNSTKDAPVTVSELSLHAVVTPALSFAFTQSWFVLPQAFLHRFEEKISVPLAARTSYYYFSYLRHVFGHHIAPNGP